MADSNVRVNFSADVSDVRRGTQQVVKDIDKVNKAAKQSSVDAARGSAKALAGVSRLIATGKVSAKSIDKIGKSAAGAISVASGFAGGIGAALGLGALPALSDLAIKAIGAVREANKSLASRINDAAAAQRNLTLAQINARGSQEGLTQAQSIAIKAQQKLDSARLNSNHTTEYMQKLESDAKAAADAVTVAQITLAESIGKSDVASKKFAGTLQKEANTALKHFTLGTVEYDSNGVNYVKTTTDMVGASKEYAKQLRENAGSAKGLTRDQKLLQLSLANYVETTQTVPEDIATVVQLLGQGKTTKQIQEYLGLIEAVPKTAKTKIQTPGMNRALGDAKGLYGAMARLDGKTVTTKIINITVRRDLREGDGSATGSMIAGKFDGKDNIPVWVSKGEAILNPRQIGLVNSGMTVEGALGATGGQTIRAGGSFAGGGKPKHSLDYRKAQVAVEAARKRLREAEKKYGKGSLQARQAQVALDSAEDRLRKAGGKEKGAAATRRAEQTQKVLDTAKDRFGATMSADDLQLAKAERTPTFTDDSAVLKSQQRHIVARIQEIRRLRKRKGLTRAQRQDLNDEEASLIRQLTDIGGQLAPDTGGGGGAADVGGEAAGADPFEVDRARIAGVTEGLGRANAYVFGGTGDIGYGQGGSAIQSAGSVHFENVSFTNSVQNTAAFAQASNVGNDLISGGRIRSSRQTVAFGG